MTSESLSADNGFEGVCRCLGGVVCVGERAIGAVAAPGARGQEGRGPVQVSLRRNV